MEQQKTIKKELRFSGIGVHSGKASSIILKPAPQGRGIIFCNSRFPDQDIVLGEIIPEIAMHATVLRQKSWAISTTEHLLAAIAGLGIDNLIIQVEGTEIPIMDGSALPFAQALEMGGFVYQNASRKKLYPKKELTFQDDQGRLLQIMPPGSDGSGVLSIEYQGDAVHPLLEKKTIQEVVSPQNFIKHIAPARTYGFLEQVELLRSHGLAQGANLGNTVVIGQGEIINQLRFPDECSRHKVLDLIGDLAVLGYPLVAQVKARRTGHSFNRNVVKDFITNPSNWILK